MRQRWLEMGGKKTAPEEIFLPQMAASEGVAALSKSFLEMVLLQSFDLVAVAEWLGQMDMRARDQGGETKGKIDYMLCKMLAIFSWYRRASMDRYKMTEQARRSIRRRVKSLPTNYLCLV